ncbi:acyl-CoA dehydrogenase family protein [Mycobacterium sp. URHB0021]|jgi:long-chain-acyl-CoA dehydrogenase
MKRLVFETEHEPLRETARQFLEKNARRTSRSGSGSSTANHKWPQANTDSSASTCRRSTAAGGRRLSVQRGHRGGISQIRPRGPRLSLQNDIVGPYFASLATDEQKQRWLPGYLSGELIGAMVINEPGAGSDPGGIKTSTVRDGDDWMVNGSKTFISAGINGDLVIVVAAPIPRPATRTSRCWWSRARRQPARPGG